MIMRWDKWGAGVLIRSGLLSGIERSEARQLRLLRILAYHRIGDPAQDAQRGDPSLFSITAEGFAEQMAYLAEHYNVISPPELLAALAGQPLLPRAVLITFDDAYHDFLDAAWPVLQRLKLPALLFAPTDYLYGNGHMFWWDRLYQAFARTDCCELRLPPLGSWAWSTSDGRFGALKAIRMLLRRMPHDEAMAVINRVVEALAVKLDGAGLLLTWDEVREMCRRGLYVGAHTASHPILSRVPTEAARQEIVQSQARVQAELGRSWPIFCYPVGHPPDLRPDLITVLREEGFRAAVTMIEGHNIIGRSEPLSLRRVGIAPHLTIDEFRLVLTRAYNLYGALAQVGPKDWK